MIVFAVDERRESIARIAFDPLPDVEHGSARSVNHHAADLAEYLEVSDRDSEGRKDHHIFRFHAAEIDATVFRHEERDPHRLEFRVHVRIMDDLPCEIDGTIRELLSGLISVLYRTFHPVTEPEFLG